MTTSTRRVGATAALLLGILLASEPVIASVNVAVIGPAYRTIAVGSSLDVDVELSATSEHAQIFLKASYFNLPTDRWLVRGTTRPGCGTEDLHSGSLGGGTFIDAMHAGESRTCRFVVTRTAAALGDMSLGFRALDHSDDLGAATILGTGSGVGLGDLTDVELRIEQKSFYLDARRVAHNDLLLSVTNHGPTGIMESRVGFCLVGLGFPFGVEGSGPNGCGDGSLSPVCFDSGFGYAIPALATGESYSCHLRLTGLGTYAGPTSYPISLDNPLPKSGGLGASVIDFNPSNNLSALSLALATPASVPSSHAGFLLTLSIAFAVIGALSIYRGRHGARTT